MEIQIPSSVTNPEKIYYREVLLKKEASRVWTEYYAVLCDRYLVFNRKDPRTGKFIENNCTMLELTTDATVGYLRKTCYRFPFYLKMGKLNYHFKCETNFQRYRWVCTLRLAIARKPPEPPPKFVPTRYCRGKLARKEDRFASKGSRDNHPPRGQHPARANGHLNGRCAQSSENLSGSEDEGALSHSSHAVRLQQDKDSLLLTNKSAIREEKPHALFETRVRRLSFADNDLEIEDLDETEQAGSTGSDKCGIYRRNSRVQRTTSNGSNNSQGKKKTVSINECPTDMEQEHSTKTIRSEENLNSGMSEISGTFTEESPRHLAKAYRVYPDNVKSHSWTSLEVMRKSTVTRRENSAPPATRRERRLRKNLVEKFQSET